MQAGFVAGKNLKAKKSKWIHIIATLFSIEKV